MSKLIAIIWFVLFICLGIVWAGMQPLLIFLSTACAFIGNGKAAQWGKNCWVGKDNLVSAQLGGDPDETISSRLGKAQRANSRYLSFVAGKVDLVAKELFNDPYHCQTSIEADEGKDQVTGR